MTFWKKSLPDRMVASAVSPYSSNQSARAYSNGSAG